MTPTITSAWRFYGTNAPDWLKERLASGRATFHGGATPFYTLHTPTGDKAVNFGDWIIMHENGELDRRGAEEMDGVSKTETPTGPVERVTELLAKATPGPWELQDGCSWRRIGTQGHNGNVLCPYNSPTDNHPDLMAGRGEDTYANLNLIVEAVNALPSLLAQLQTTTDDLARERERAEKAEKGVLQKHKAMMAAQREADRFAHEADTAEARADGLAGEVAKHSENVDQLVYLNDVTHQSLAAAETSLTKLKSDMDEMRAAVRAVVYASGQTLSGQWVINGDAEVLLSSLSEFLVRTEGEGAAKVSDMRAVVEALGFEPDNHHNALHCPYCNPKGLTWAAALRPQAQGDAS